VTSKEVRPGSPEQAERPEWSLILQEADGVERVIESSDSGHSGDSGDSGDTEPDLPITIGRGVECGVRIDSPYVSRTHARIEWLDGALWLVDLGSRNGSLLNGERWKGAHACAMVTS
jgi:pSer/pThr/pTyr-binding forkhead associated (FHA) protein